MISRIKKKHAHPTKTKTKKRTVHEKIMSPYEIRFRPRYLIILDRTKATIRYAVHLSHSITDFKTLLPRTTLTLPLTSVRSAANNQSHLLVLGRAQNEPFGERLGYHK